MAGGVKPWRSRLVDHADVDPTQLVANALNWRIHPAAQRRNSSSGTIKRATDRLTAGFEYVGPPMDREQARRLLGAR